MFKVLEEWNFGILFVGFVSVAVLRQDLEAEPLISEFLAQNNASLSDDDGDRSDWIELFNPDAVAWDLTNWSLTDDPAVPSKWSFPELSLRSGGYLVVFASGKDRSQLGAPLHTNFRLANGGEFLGLVNPEGEVVSSFGARYPAQIADVSYGTGQSEGQETVLLSAGANATALIPTDGSLGDRWTGLAYDDSDWLAGRTAVGYDYSPFVRLDVGAMRGQNASVFVRVPFEIDSDIEVDRLVLRLRYEDGFVAYLNGERVAAGNAPNTLSWNSTATADRPDASALSPIDIDISSAKDLLREGENVLSIHGLNRSVTSSDILVEPELVSVKTGEIQNAGYLFNPSPGEENLSSVPVLYDSPEILVGSRVFQTAFEVALALSDETLEGAIVRYTLDGSVPDLSSLEYSEPILIDRTVQLRVRAFGPDGAGSPVVSATYVQALPEVAEFTSDLPLIILENFQGGRPPQNVFQNGFMTIIEPETGARSELTGVPTLQSRVGLKVRGSSTSGRPKPSLSLEARGEYDEGLGITPLGLPRDSDWVLWGPYNFDLSLIHNPFIYELSNQIGRYAPRTRFVEVFLNTGGGALRADDYFGVYALTEKIKRDDDRVDVAKLFPEHDREPNVTGGYVLKIDRADPGDSGFSSAGQTVRYVSPKESLIEQSERDAQERYIRGFFTEMGRALNGSSFKDPETGYAKYIDVDAAIDHHLLNVLAFNVDALRLSGYMHLPRGGKLTFGPIWDFDRALGSTDGRDSNPATWRSQSGDRGTDFFNYPWWNRMFRDIDFFQKYIDRFQSLRRAQFSEGHMNQIVDDMADELMEAQQRNLDRWNQRPRSQFGRTYQGEIDYLKRWLASRVSFMESQFVDAPTFSIASGRLTPGMSVSIASKDGGEIYYTLDGSDPRTSGGNMAQSVMRYTEPITIDSGVRLIARVRNLEHTSLTGANNPPLSSKWSGPVTRVFSVDDVPLVGDLEISEVHYNPLPLSVGEGGLGIERGSSALEFIELRNRSDRTLDLSGLRVEGGISYEFPPDQLNSLAPGSTLVLVGNREAYELRYGVSRDVVYEYRGNLDNDRDVIELIGADGMLLERLAYEDKWYPATDGLGFSLTHRGSIALGESASSASHYGPSALIGGSPGEPGGVFSGVEGIIVSEILNNSTAPELDAIEIANRGELGVDIGGWFLTDDLQVPNRFIIPSGTVIEPGGWWVVDQSSFGAESGTQDGFGLSSRGESVYLIGVNEDGGFSGYVDGFEFAALPEGRTQGPWTTSLGERLIVPFESASLGGGNSRPGVGPIVVSEVFYGPSRTDESGSVSQIEFVELTNQSMNSVLLGAEDDLAVQWRIRGGIQFDFPSGFELGAGASLVLTSEGEMLDFESFRTQWGLSTDILVLGPFSGRLENSGDSIRVERSDLSLRFGDRLEFYPVDVVDYSGAAPWPSAASLDRSLQRVSGREVGSDAMNWVSHPPNPGQFVSGMVTEIEGIALDSEGVVLTVRVDAPGRFALESSSDILSEIWERDDEFSVDANTGNSIELLDDQSTSQQRFYRVVRLP